MKALISPNEVFTYKWISSWFWTPDPTPENPDAGFSTPVYSEIIYCQRVAEVEPDDKVFEVCLPLHWVTCPDDCVADQWYYKEGQCFIKPQDEPDPYFALNTEMLETPQNDGPNVIA